MLGVSFRTDTTEQDMSTLFKSMLLATMNCFHLVDPSVANHHKTLPSMHDCFLGWSPQAALMNARECRQRAERFTLATQHLRWWLPPAPRKHVTARQLCQQYSCERNANSGKSIAPSWGSRVATNGGNQGIGEGGGHNLHTVNAARNRSWLHWNNTPPG